MKSSLLSKINTIGLCLFITLATMRSCSDNQRFDLDEDIIVHHEVILRGQLKFDRMLLDLFESKANLAPLPPLLQPSPPPKPKSEQDKKPKLGV